ncbi:hypothetical protein HG531_006597 [Fusarium graminearum]|nr:hypothetical protein HG531_006597 [Fusarium graminearum]
MLSVRITAGHRPLSSDDPCLGLVPLETGSTVAKLCPAVLWLKATGDLVVFHQLQNGISELVVILIELGSIRCILLISVMSKLLFLWFDMEMGWEMADMPDTEAGPDLKLPEAECGLLSGKMALIKNLLTRIRCDVVLGQHSIRLRVDNDAQKEDEKQAPPDQPARGVFDILVVELLQNGISQLQESFGYSSGILVVDKLKQLVYGSLVELLGCNLVRVVPVGEVESGTMLVLGPVQQKGSVFQNLHQVPFHIGLAGPVTHCCPNVENRNQKVLSSGFRFRNQAGQSRCPNIGSSLILRTIRSSGIGKAGMDKNGERIVTLERQQSLNVHSSAVFGRTCVDSSSRTAMEGQDGFHRSKTTVGKTLHLGVEEGITAELVAAVAYIMDGAVKGREILLVVTTETVDQITMSYFPAAGQAGTEGS